MFKDKNVLITGATGLIGSHLVNELLKEKANLILTGRNIKKLNDVFEDNYNIKKIACDITSNLPNDLPELDYIFHTAGPISGNDIKNYPVNLIKANILGLINCFEFLKKQKEKTGKIGKTIVFSSATVYGINKQNKDVSIKEEETETADSLDCIQSIYSESKRIVEVIAKSYHQQYELETVIARISYAYGYTQFIPQRAFYEFIQQAINGGDIVLNNPQLSRRDNIYADDIVSGLLILAQNGISGESYNLSSNGDEDNFRSLDEIAHIIVDCVNKKMGKNIKLIEPENKNRLPGTMLNNSKIKSLGWKVNTNIVTGIEKTIDKYIDLMRK